MGYLAGRLMYQSFSLPSLVSCYAVRGERLGGGNIKGFVDAVFRVGNQIVKRRFLLRADSGACE